MPILSGGAQRASLRTPVAGTITWLRRPRPLLGALALALLLPLAPSTLAAAPAAAARACGTWRSQVTPPPSIRVLRTATGDVEEVHFATYVATVMASGEWPTHMPMAALEVGATAVKQYAWYYALRGHHRAGYRTRDGRCYDVRDDTMDQLYKPESVRPTQKQLRALAATWALSLRKNGRFFLTGYRAGTGVSCARDADGWRLYEASVVHCARKGWSRERIQERYYAPHLRFVWDYATATSLAAALAAAAEPVDRRAPVVLAPRVEVRKGALLDGLAGRVRWAAADAGLGLDGFEVQRRIDGGPWTDVTPEVQRARGINVPLDPTVRIEFRVRARDDAGNRSGWAPSDAVMPTVVESAAEVPAHGWTTVREAGASGGSVERATRRGAKVSLVFRGHGVAIVAPTGPAYGVVRIRERGITVATVNLRRLPKSDARVIWSRTWHGDRRHRIGLVVSRVSGGRHVDVDAFLILR